MSKNGVLKVLATLTAAYMKDLPDPTIRLYVNGLSDLDDSALVGAAEELIVNNKFFPTIADLRRAAVYRSMPGGRPPSTDVAWHEVMVKVNEVGVVDRTYPDCAKCQNTRFVTVVEDVERLQHCDCLYRAIQQPRPPFSHVVIGAALDLCGGYNKLCRASDKQRDVVKRAFAGHYEHLISEMIGRASVPADLSTKELPE